MIVYEVIYKRDDISNKIHEVLSAKRINTENINSFYIYLYNNNYVIDAAIERMQDDNDIGYLYTNKIDFMTLKCIINIQNKISAYEDFHNLKKKMIPIIRNEIINCLL